jgi:hypothetical protein
MTQSAQFQQQASMFANRAADRLQEAAKKVRNAYENDALPSDTMTALETLRGALFDAYTCIGHASHQHALAVLHKEREKA